MNKHFKWKKINIFQLFSRTFNDFAVFDLPLVIANYVHAYTCALNIKATYGGDKPQIK